MKIVKLDPKQYEKGKPTGNDTRALERIQSFPAQYHPDAEAWPMSLDTRNVDDNIEICAKLLMMAGSLRNIAICVQKGNDCLEFGSSPIAAMLQIEAELQGMAIKISDAVKENRRG